MRLLSVSLLVPLTAAYDVAKTHGVKPALTNRYVASSSDAWTCLDGSKEIAWKAVNDDYCDCPDGSDEPGTGACPNTTFYCENAGHIGASIPSSHVRDGLCETDCCDGSDERPGVCPNQCKEIGEAYRAKVDAERKLRKTGSKIRSSYISFAQKEKKRLEEVLATATKEMEKLEKEVKRLKSTLDQAEAVSAEALELKKQSPLYQSLIEHANALKSLQREHEKHLEREQALGDILDSLRRGYNPNYQDMAVLEAVRGWEQLAGLKHIGHEDEEEAASDAEPPAAEEEELEEGMWSALELEENLGDLLDTDYVSLLLEHDKNAAPAAHSLLHDVSEYLPDTLRNTALGWLGGSSESSGTSSAGTTKLRETLTKAEKELADRKKEHDNAKQDIDELFDPKFFGSQGEWRQPSNKCLSKDTGDYTYEVCLFGEAKQKPNKGGQTFSLGHFSGWNTNAEVGSPEYYSRQSYTLGTKCWNGPQRSVKLELSCGTENTLLTVQELEKCEYQFTATTPALDCILL
ncbi:unnamed protein product [Peniophora sp. CBMAI 1063]|nr:unnamed protein product [Peniophora sp. CBMAI 1063]